jgi:hypothetical protein
MKVKTPDLPYARRKGEIEAPEIRGQISSSDGIGPVNLLSTRLISRLLLSPLIAHDALVWSLAGARLRLGSGACCRFSRRSWLRLWHALLAAMLSALILHTFKIVFFGHRDRTLFRSDGYTFARSPCEFLRQPPAELMPFDTTGFRGLRTKRPDVSRRTGLVWGSRNTEEILLSEKASTRDSVPHSGSKFNGI